ncbi:MAG: DUF1824 family protein [Timaviella obliquedivisa GSE-PSE-MK23-08B]|jgi:hypothetical protein|nr:DUF1824 family protein [Timaviella obliquedivisa GSE-PSE-MK23-08B]
MSDSTPLDLETAHRILKQFGTLKPASIPGVNQTRVQQALLLAASQSDYQMLGVCADTLEQGILALQGYAEALSYSPTFNLEPVEGSVYIKFNPNSAKCYASPYDGEHRGVLVSCQSADDADVNETYGHLPLDLFEHST